MSGIGITPYAAGQFNEHQPVDGAEGVFLLEQSAAERLFAAATSKSLPQALPATGSDRWPSNQ
jgi:hypothetical protein